MKKTVLFLFLWIGLFLFAQEKKTSYAKAKIYYSNKLDLEKMSSNGIPVDHGIFKKNTYIESVFSDKQLQKAKALGFDVVEEIEDMAAYVQKRKAAVSKNTSPCNVTSDYVTPTNFELGSMGGFYTLDEMLQELDDMHSLYPNLITVKTGINNFLTEENRSIYYVKISDNPTVDENEPEMLFTAVHHAREPAAMQQLIYYMWYLLENYATDDEIKSIVDNTEQFFVPIVNPDGYHYNQTTNPNGGGYWRKNRKNNGAGNFGVDNNRNYGYHWGESGVSGPDGDTYNGTASFSEVENQAIKWLCEQHQFIVAINNHTFSNLLLYPFGYDNNTPTTDNAIFEGISGAMVQKNGYVNEIASALYPASGDSDDWMYGDTSTTNKIFAMTPEIGDSFWPAQTEIEGICKKMLYHNITAAHLISNYAELAIQPDDYVSNLNFTINYTIKRLGLQGTGNFSVSAQPISANIISVGNTNSHNNMTLLQEESDSITLDLSPSIQQGDAISYKLVINNGLFDKEYVVNQIYGTPTTVFYANGNVTNIFETSNWGISQAEFYSPPYSLTDSQNSTYDNNTNSDITVLNTIDLSDATQALVSFYAKWNIEKSFDYVQFEISIDNGVTWIPQCGKYTSLGTDQQGILNEPMYDGIQNNWIREEIDLSDYLGEMIKFRFQLVSDDAVTADGFYFDELKVQKLTSNTTNIKEFVNANFEIYPNPSHDFISIHANNSTQFNLTIFDINGKKLYSKDIHSNYKNLNINTLTKGIYFITLKTNILTKTFKFIKN